MKKIFNIIMIALTFSFLNLIPVENVNAASATIAVKGSKTVVVGNTVKVTITLSSASALGSWEFDLKYDTSKLTLVSSTLESSTRSTNVMTNSKTKSKTYTLTFRAKAKGNAKISIANSLVFGWDETKMSTTNGSLTVNIISQKDLEDSYSSNNYLKSLSVDGYELNPKFNKNTLEYNLELENNIESIVVKASKEDSKASISGTGVHKLTEGDNKITVSVMAENGNVRNYVINATVKELNPISIKIGDDEYTVVRKTEELDIPSTFIETTTLIEGEEVPAFESTISGYQLIALKNKDGIINFYINEGNNKYSLYKEINFNGIVLYPIEPLKNSIPEGFLKTNPLQINDIEVIAYQSEEYIYPIIYGMNIETGKKGWYSFDEEEKSLQRYKEIEISKDEVADKYLILIGLLSMTLLITLIFITILNRKYIKIKIKKES